MIDACWVKAELGSRLLENSLQTASSSELLYWLAEVLEMLKFDLSNEAWV